MDILKYRFGFEEFGLDPPFFCQKPKIHTFLCFLVYVPLSCLVICELEVIGLYSMNFHVLSWDFGVTFCTL